MKNKKGFTLVELLVVIAIIGILSSVAVVNLNSARSRAKEAAVLGWLDQVNAEILLCLDNGVAMRCVDDRDPTGTDLCGDLQDFPSAGEPVCFGSNVLWIDVGTKYPGWSYSGVFTSNVSAMTWTTEATDGVKNVTCEESGCVVTEV
ncbi:type II secretion system protein [bacterium]|jgi:prepilin-type N-terminal cleavage/methylation domain-containing protein|nr:type II secretion system protein [bacterium]